MTKVHRLRGFLAHRGISSELSVAVAAATTALLCTASFLVGATSTRVLVAALAVLQAASLRWMRAYPEWSMAASLAAGAGILALWPPLGVFGLANLSLCLLANVRPPRVSLRALGAMLLLAAWPALARGTLAGVIAAGGSVLSWSWGELLRTHRDRRRDEARQAVTEEQMRIARELHDVVAHNVSLIVVQAVAADDVFDAHPEQAREALRTIETSGRAALGELRRLLGTVRPDAGPQERDPQPGLRELDQLVASVRAAGLDVTVRYEGEPVPVPAGVDLSAYRIVQEALTNVLRHARARRAAVTVRYAPTRLEVEISDDGRGLTGPVDGGHGLIGMRERAALLGGVLELGRGVLGGMSVRVTVPIDGSVR